MFYMTDRARKSAIESIDLEIDKLANSSGAVRDIGYLDVRSIIIDLGMLKKAIEEELTGLENINDK